MSRRTALAGAGAAGLAARAGAATVLSDPGGELSLRLTIGGNTRVFRERDGEDLGDFQGQGFTQRCVRAMQSGSPLTVMFRPDRGSERSEFVVELGRLWQSTPEHLGAYSATLLRGDKVLTTVNVPQHYWQSRWRWMSQPRPVIAKVEDLRAKGLVPPYGSGRAIVGGGSLPSSGAMPQASGATPHLPGGSSAPAAVRRRADGTLEVAPAAPAPGARDKAIGNGAQYQVMGMAGITPYMPQTGDREEIGPLTEPQAIFLLTGAGAALSRLLAQAEAAGTVPWHMRDEHTGAPINLEQYPKAHWYESAEVGSPHIKRVAAPVVPDSAHSPALAFLPFLLTGDPYFLEALQFQASWDLGAAPPTYRIGVPTFSVGQTRAHAWTLRNLAHAVVATPERTPRWLLPRAYWRRWLDADLAWYERNMVKNPATERSVFRAIDGVFGWGDEPNAPAGTWYAPWQDEFEAFIQGWLVMMGFTERTAAFRWKIASTIARTNGKSGWLRAASTPYRLKARKSKAVPFVATWAEAWQLSAGAYDIRVTDPNLFQGNAGYLGYTQATLALATHLDIPEARECLAWANAQLQVQRYQLPNRWRIAH